MEARQLLRGETVFWTYLFEEMTTLSGLAHGMAALGQLGYHWAAASIRILPLSHGVPLALMSLSEDSITLPGRNHGMAALGQVGDH